MNPAKHSSVVTCLFACLIGGACLNAHAEADPLNEEQFSRLRDALRVKNQPWAKVRWQSSVTEARALAAASRKPIFLVVNTGNCLGFV